LYRAFNTVFGGFSQKKSSKTLCPSIFGQFGSLSSQNFPEKRQISNFKFKFQIGSWRLNILLFFVAVSEAPTTSQLGPATFICESRQRHIISNHKPTSHLFPPLQNQQDGFVPSRELCPSERFSLSPEISVMIDKRRVNFDEF